MIAIRKKPEPAMLLTHAPTPIHLIATLVSETPPAAPAGSRGTPPPASSSAVPLDKRSKRPPSAPSGRAESAPGQDSASPRSPATHRSPTRNGSPAARHGCCSPPAAHAVDCRDAVLLPTAS